jgi:hypothetical protein
VLINAQRKRKPAEARARRRQSVHSERSPKSLLESPEMSAAYAA